MPSDAYAGLLHASPTLGSTPAERYLALSIAGNPMINGSTIRLDGAIRMPPR